MRASRQAQSSEDDHLSGMHIFSVESQTKIPLTPLTWTVSHTSSLVVLPF